MNPIRLGIVITLSTIVYSLGYLMWYWGTPLGQSPVLDGLENLVTAQKIFTGNLVHEPFYRAMLYPGVLSAFLFLGVDAANLPFFAGLLGFLLHVVVTALSLRLSWVIWSNRAAMVITGVLVGFNPVFIHFALDPLDIALATALFLGGVCLMKEIDPARVSVVSRIGSGVLLALSPLARPHLFAPLVVIGLILFGVCVWKRSGWKSFFLIGSGGAVPLILYGLVQLAWGHSFGVLPWQGAYNLWASNKPEANGLYFKQSVFIHDLGEHQNPTKVESEILFERETGAQGSISEKSDYWRSKTIKSVLDNPMQWVGLMAWKSYALVNDYEQYNNKTFSFHKERSPWLKFNPISAGVLLVLGAMGLTVLWRDSRSIAIASLLVIGGFGGGLMIYMVSGRFRAPMIPCLAVLAGGVSFVPVLWQEFEKFRKFLVVGVPLFFGILSFSKFGDIALRDTDIQDVMLLADASAKLGRDLDAISWSEKAIRIDPTREDAIRIKLISFYNLAISDQNEDLDWRQFESQLEKKQISDSNYEYVKGVAFFNLEKREEAVRVWGSALQRYGWEASSSLGALLIVDPDLEMPELSDNLIREMREGAHSVLSAAICIRDPSLVDVLYPIENKFSGMMSGLERVFHGKSID